MPTKETFCAQDGITLRTYFDERINMLKELLNARFEAMEKAVNIASKDMDNRLGELNDVRLRFLPRQEYDARHETLIQRIEAVEKEMVRQAGKESGVGYGWGVILGAIAAVGAVIALVLNAIRLFTVHI